VVSFKGQQVAQESAAGLNFNAEYNDNLDPTNAANLNAARTNAFFIMNVMHDFSYRYGFTESAFNFQQSNFGKGGQEQDHVLVSVQDASGTNNANFATPPEFVSSLSRLNLIGANPLFSTAANQESAGCSFGTLPVSVII